MDRHQFYKLEIGDYVQITQHGQNNGKIGRVTKVYDRGLGYGGSVYLTPYNCEFGFSNPRKREDGSYSFNHQSLKYLGKSPEVNIEKIFTLKLNKKELNIIKEWYHVVLDLNPKYLEQKDRDLYEKIGKE
jgi:hypothetical protein